MKYLLCLSYDGTAYHGWQVQNNCVTVQGVITDIAKKIFGVTCMITGCSRTDSGVHAVNYMATLEPCGNEYPHIPSNKLLLALNSNLPDDIAVNDVKTVSDSFHARYDVKSKEYLYRIYDHSIKDPFEHGRSYAYCRPLDVEKMKEAAKYFVGTHDFSSFMSSGSDITDTVRTVYSVSIERKNRIVEIRIRGNGFLYNMVRIIVGTLIEVSKGAIEIEDIPGIIESCNRSNSGMTVPACGLYLENVDYDK